MNGKPRIKKNAWDNWYGYRGNRKVMIFANDDFGSQQDNAEQWLREQLAIDMARARKIEPTCGTVVYSNACAMLGGAFRITFTKRTAFVYLPGQSHPRRVKRSALPAYAQWTSFNLADAAQSAPFDRSKNY